MKIVLMLTSFLLALDEMQCSGWPHPDCGRNLVSRRSKSFIGEWQAKEGEFPWQVHLIMRTWDQEFSCGGSIITPSVVLTAAHCVEGIIEEYSEITAGSINLLKRGPYFQARNVKEVIMHNSFDLKTLSNDIALIKIRNPFDIEESEGHIGTICIPKKMFRIMNKVTVTGWGKISANGPSMADMHAAVVPVKEDLICGRQNERYNTQSMFCAGTSGKELCEGDSGSAAVQTIGGVFVQVGIVAFGYECAERPETGFYTNVSKFSHWIENKLNILL